MKNVAIIGASDKTDRYSYKACMMLLEYGHKIFPIHPTLKTIANSEVYTSIDDIEEDIDTLTIYVNPKRVMESLAQIKRLSPKRVIFNPGTESLEAKKELEESGIATLEACTLVLLRTNAF